jgi:hypothetical protein
VLVDRLQLPVSEFATATGWSIEPQGACLGDRCVPLPDGALTADGVVDVATVTERLGMALVGPAAGSPDGPWAIGPEAAGRALSTARLPELTLPDRHGRPFSLSSLRGTRFVMIAWASW